MISVVYTFIQSVVRLLLIANNPEPEQDLLVCIERESNAFKLSLKQLGRNKYAKNILHIHTYAVLELLVPTYILVSCTNSS